MTTFPINIFNNKKNESFFFLFSIHIHQRQFMLCFSYRYESNNKKKSFVIEYTTQYNSKNLFLNICDLVQLYDEIIGLVYWVLESLSNLM